MDPEDFARENAGLVNIRLDDEQSRWVRIDENGVVDLPLSVVRKLAEWVRRYDLRPKNPTKPVVRQ